MFGMLESLTKAAISVVTLPVSLTADVITLGGAITEQEQPYTKTNLENVYGNLKDAAKRKE
jgi:hypothetical protein